MTDTTPDPLVRTTAIRATWQFLMALIVAALSLSACATSASLAAPDVTRVDRLLTLIGDRLEVASDVARSKWNSKAPVEDLGREQQIVSSVGTSASRYNVPRDIAERFFRAQIEASKIIQRATLAEFEAARQPRFATVADLEQDIRPRLDGLTPELMRALGEVLPVLEQPEGRAAVAARTRRFSMRVPGGERAVHTAVAPLLETQ